MKITPRILWLVFGIRSPSREFLKRVNSKKGRPLTPDEFAAMIERSHKFWEIGE